MKAEMKNDDLTDGDFTFCWECTTDRWNYQDPQVELREFLGRVFCDECGTEL